MQIEENKSLAPLTTLRIGGPARFFINATTEADLVSAVNYGRSEGLRTAILGGGSNLVVPDEGFDGLVIRAARGQCIQTSHTEEGYLLQVDAGVEWDAFVQNACHLGVFGVECLAGIPGLTGAAPVQNIGAYGQEVSSTIRTVRALDLTTMEFVELTAEACGFLYRHSIFNCNQRGRYVITRVDFFFPADARAVLTYADLAPLRGKDVTPLEVYHFVREIRARKGMLIDAHNPEAETRSAGSFFRNPVVPAEQARRISAAAGELRVPQWALPSGEVKLAAAWLVEQAGFPKEFKLGPVGVSSKHALALVNRTGEAKAADLFRLRDAIVGGVAEKFGVRLEQEPVTLE